MFIFPEESNIKDKIWWKSLLQTVGYLLTPKYCLYCQRQIYNDIGLCRHCWQNIQWASATHIDRKEVQLMEHFPISHLYSLAPFHQGEEIRELIHHLKYNHRKEIGFYLGEIIGERIQDSWSSFAWDIVVPIPLHFIKKWRRGYNQSDYIGQGIASVLHIPLIKDGLKRVRYTKTQTQLDKEKRTHNMNDAFAIQDREALQGKRILLVDDVFTTGATLNGALKALAHLNGIEVGVATISLT